MTAGLRVRAYPHSPGPHADAARRLVETTRRAQGLPATITDAAVLEKVAAIVATLPKASDG